MPNHPLVCPESHRLLASLVVVTAMMPSTRLHPYDPISQPPAWWAQRLFCLLASSRDIDECVLQHAATLCNVSVPSPRISVSVAPLAQMS